MAADLLNIDADIDMTSPASPRNMFDTTNVTRDLGVQLDRGHDGIRNHLNMLIEAMQ